MNWFQRLPPFLQERIHAEMWEDWRPVQKEAFKVLFDGEGHLLVTAGTSSGKTEAAMLPVASSLYFDPPEGFGALYVGPTKALIDDQFARMDRLLRDSPVAVTGWHGDVSVSIKSEARGDPEGVLQITPESLQGLVTSGPDEVRRLFGGLRFVIIDEVHSFMGSERGLQLLCELATIERIAGCTPRRIGLSATVSNVGDACEWLRAGTPWRVSVVRSESDTSGAVGIKQFTIPEGDGRARALNSYYRELFRLSDGRSCVVFVNTRESAEMTAMSLAKVSEAMGSHDPVGIHHGSLSKGVRDTAVRDLNAGLNPTVVATSTLELGVDIGGLDRVLQVGAPQSCSSLLQRMGRTGRRGGRREAVIFCLDDESKWSPAPPGVHADLVRSIAVADLAVRGGWTEPIRANPLPFGLLYHQMLAYLLGAGRDVKWPELRDALLSMWPFRNVSKEEILELARHMLAAGHLQRMEDGTLLIGLKAESVVHGRDFPTVFKVPEEIEVRCRGRVIGWVMGCPTKGSFTLAGRIWRTVRVHRGWVEVEEEQRFQQAGSVSAHSGWVEESDSDETTSLNWVSSAPGVDDAVMARMRKVLSTDDDYPWLDSSAREALVESRAAYRQRGYDGFAAVPGGFRIYPWMGTRRFEALTRALRDVEGVRVAMIAAPYWIEISTGLSERAVKDAVSDLVGRSDPEDFVLLDDLWEMGKYERYVPEGLRAREFAASRFDFEFDIKNI